MGTKTKTKKKGMHETHSKFNLKLLKKSIDVVVDLVWPLLIDKVSSPFNHYHFLQQGYKFLEATFVYKIFNPWNMIGQVQFPNDKLCWHLNLSSSPCRVEFPISVIKSDLELRQSCMHQIHRASPFLNDISCFH